MGTFSDKHLQAVLKGQRAIAPVHYPGAPHIKMGVRILSDEDHDEAREAAAKYTSDRAKLLMLEARDLLLLDPEHTDPEIQRQLIAKAFVDPDSPPALPKPFFENIAAIRQLPSVHREVLFQMYADHQNAVCPLHTLDDAAAKELVDALKKGQVGLALLGMYDAPALRSLVRSLASRLSS